MKHVFKFVVASSLLFSGTPALADESSISMASQTIEEAEGLGFTFRPRVGYGTADYKLELTEFSVNEVKADYEPLTFGGALISDNFFLDVSYSSGSGEADLPGYDFDREETIVNAGFRLNSTSFYVGYMSAESEFKAATGSSATFESSGFLIGLGQGIPAFGGSFSIGAGLAFLEGTFTGESGDSDDADFTVGFSGTLGYGYPITSHINLRGDVKYNAYSFDFTSTSGGTADESVVSLLLSVAYAF